MPEFLGSWEFIVLALLFLVLFGAKRLPDSARALGRSMRIFKAETKGLRGDDGVVVSPAGIAPAVVEPDVASVVAPVTPVGVPVLPVEQPRPVQQ